MWAVTFYFLVHAHHHWAFGLGRLRGKTALYGFVTFFPEGRASTRWGHSNGLGVFTTRPDVYFMHTDDWYQVPARRNSSYWGVSCAHRAWLGIAGRMRPTGPLNGCLLAAGRVEEQHARLDLDSMKSRNPQYHQYDAKC